MIKPESLHYSKAMKRILSLTNIAYTTNTVVLAQLIWESMSISPGTAAVIKHHYIKALMPEISV